MYTISTLGELRELTRHLDDAVPLTGQAEAGQVSVSCVGLHVVSLVDNNGRTGHQLVIDLDV